MSVRIGTLRKPNLILVVLSVLAAFGLAVAPVPAHRLDSHPRRQETCSSPTKPPTPFRSSLRPVRHGRLRHDRAERTYRPCV